MNIETVAQLSPLFTLALAGLFWLAYYHPLSYVKLANVLLICSAATYMLATAWDVGFNSGARGAYELAVSNGYEGPMLEDPINMMQWLIIHLIFWVFITGLQYIHRLKDGDQ